MLSPRETCLLRLSLTAVNDTYSPLVFDTNGGVGSECSMFLAALAEKLSVVQGGARMST